MGVFSVVIASPPNSLSMLMPRDLVMRPRESMASCGMPPRMLTSELNAMCCEVCSGSLLSLPLSPPLASDRLLACASRRTEIAPFVVST
jgi:hypothetical protein